MNNLEGETKILLIRHGSVENPNDICYGRLPIPLSQKGEDEILHLARELIYRGVKVDAIYSSPIVRAIQSSLIIKKELGINRLEIKDALTDLGIGSLEGAPMQIIRDLNYNEEEIRRGGFGIEAKEDVVRRVGKVIDEIVENHPGETIALVNHGDTTRLGLWYLENPGETPPINLRDEKYPAVAEAVLIRFSGGDFLDAEFIGRRESVGVESDHMKRTKAD